MGEAGIVKYPTISFRDHKIVYQKKKNQLYHWIKYIDIFHKDTPSHNCGKREADNLT